MAGLFMYKWQAFKKPIGNLSLIKLKSLEFGTVTLKTMVFSVFVYI